MDYQPYVPALRLITCRSRGIKGITGIPLNTSQLVGLTAPESATGAQGEPTWFSGMGAAPTHADTRTHTFVLAPARGPQQYSQPQV